MATLEQVFDHYKDNECFRWAISSVDLTDDQITEFLRVHDCDATAEEAISYLAGLIADVPEHKLEEAELAAIGGGYETYFKQLCETYEKEKAAGLDLDLGVKMTEDNDHVKNSNKLV